MKAEIQTIIDRLKDGMLSFIEGDEDASYSSVDVDKCIDIILKHIDNIEKTTNKDEGMSVVEKTVLSLNELNEQCGFAIIETDQREDICEIIIQTGHAKGYNELTEDITENWREW